LLKFQRVKLRTTQNSIRLRLAQSDVRLFADNGFVEESVKFGPGADEVLSYRLERSNDIENVAAKLAGGRITVLIPAAEADRWTSSDDVFISAKPSEGSAGTLDILVEKDFACLTPRSGDEDLDAFPHPDAAKASH